MVYDGFKPALMFEEQSTPYIRTACRKAFLDECGIRFEEALPFGEDQVFFFDIYPEFKENGADKQQAVRVSHRT